MGRKIINQELPRPTMTTRSATKRRALNASDGEAKRQATSGTTARAVARDIFAKEPAASGSLAVEVPLDDLEMPRDLAREDKAKEPAASGLLSEGVEEKPTDSLALAKSSNEIIPENNNVVSASSGYPKDNPESSTAVVDPLAKEVSLDDLEMPRDLARENKTKEEPATSGLLSEGVEKEPASQSTNPLALAKSSNEIQPENNNVISALSGHPEDKPETSSVAVLAKEPAEPGLLSEGVDKEPTVQSTDPIASVKSSNAIQPENNSVVSASSSHRESEAPTAASDPSAKELPLADLEMPRDLTREDKANEPAAAGLLSEGVDKEPAV